ncbi:hypothetical protein [Nostoc sp. WHI]|uniref:hypothetical protein n=1 Tax=Nostoc sp. WHI TaxID=2650611 RepID=UPI001E3317E8|nr:hypothetical protein [Nostoc sp. WHI]
MLETNIIVINTAPLISIIAAIGDLRILQSLYTQVLVPFEVCQEILVGGARGFGVSEFEDAHWLQKLQIPLNNISPFLLNSLDLGEASVIQLALNENIQTVCMDAGEYHQKSLKSRPCTTNSQCMSQRRELAVLTLLYVK